MEALFPDRLEEHYGRLPTIILAAAQDEEMIKAIEYAVRAGERTWRCQPTLRRCGFYTMALEALARQSQWTKHSAYTLLLALGEAQRKAGESLQALESLQRAVDSARVLRISRAFAHAALEFEHTTWVGNLAC